MFRLETAMNASLTTQQRQLACKTRTQSQRSPWCRRTAHNLAGAQSSTSSWPSSRVLHRKLKTVICASNNTSAIEASRSTHAVVIGGGVVGMLAAKVLSSYYDRVTVYDKQQLDMPKERPEALTDDQLMQAVRQRTGAAQNGLPNILSSVAVEIAERYFPGLQDQFLQAGAFHLIPKKHVQHYINKTELPLKPVIPEEVQGTLQSKTKTETLLRYRLMTDAPNVEFVGGKGVKHFTFDERQENVTGVVLGDGVAVPADFVVHAGGRTCNPTALLAPGGYAAVPEETVDAHLTYLGMVFKNPPDATQEAKDRVAFAGGHFINTPVSREQHSYIFCQQENDRLTSIIFARTGARTLPKTAQEYVSQTKHIPIPGVHDYLQRCTPLSSKVMSFKSPNKCRRFDLMPAIPGQVVFLGDVACANSPQMGQGMTLGAQCVEALDHQLKATSHQRKDSKWVAAFPKKLSDIQFPIWASALWLDLQYSDTNKKISIATRLMAWYYTLLAEFVRDSKDPQMAGGFNATYSGIVPFSAFALNPAIVLMTMLSALKRKITSSLGAPMSAAATTTQTVEAK